MNLSEKMQMWGDLQKQADSLKQQIENEVVLLGKTIEVDDVIAQYRKSAGNGSYNYKSIVEVLNPAPEIVEKYQSVSYDWRKIAEEAGMTDEVKAQFYTPPAKSEPSVTVKFAK